MGHAPEDPRNVDLSGRAANVRKAVLAFAATDGDMSDAAQTIASRQRDRGCFVEAVQDIDSERSIRPGDVNLGRASQLLHGLLASDIWFDDEPEWDEPEWDVPSDLGERDTLEQELADISSHLGRMVSLRACAAFDALETRRWNELTRREVALLWRIKAAAPIAHMAIGPCAVAS